MYDTYRYIFIGGLVLSIVFFGLTVFLFFFLKIKDAFGDMTGSSRRKAISGKGKKTGSDKQKSKITRETSSQLTSRMSIQERYDAMEGKGETAVLKNKKSGAVSAAPPAQMRAQPANAYKPVKINDPDFVIEADITYVHSHEVIS